jgi:hypothetical protein
MKDIKVYIASPYTKGWMPDNVRRQITIGDELLDLGYKPYIPLLTHFMELYKHRDEREYLDLDIVFLSVCDAVLRIKPLDENGIEIPSAGADEEEAKAKELGIPVFYSVADLNDYFKSNSEQLKISI